MNFTRIYGLHAAQAALDYSTEKIKQAWLVKDNKNPRLQNLLSALQKQGIPVQRLDRRKLDQLSGGTQHQNIILEVALPQVRSEAELQAVIPTLTAPPFLLILDHVQDPHNLGACLRTADAAGIQGIIITKDQAVGITPTVCKVACGAAESVPVYRVTNLVRTLKWLKQQGLWVIGAAGEASESLYQTDLNLPLALVIGAEEKGLRRLTREQCDLLVKLPMHGHVESLNLSVAAGILIYEALRQRQ